MLLVLKTVPNSNVLTEEDVSVYQSIAFRGNS